MRGSLWLLPEKSCAEKLKPLQSRVQSFLSCPDFTPHITLFGGLHGDTRILEDKTAKALTQSGIINPLSLQIEALRPYPDYYRPLVLDVAISAELEQLRDAAQSQFKQDVRTFSPHISLSYGIFGAIQTTNALQEIHSENFGPVNFDYLALTTACAEVPIAQWKIIKRWSLNAANREAV